MEKAVWGLGQEFACQSCLGDQEVTCPFCGIPDERIGEQHYERHKTEALRRIAKSLESLDQLLTERLGKVGKIPKDKWEEC